MAREEPGAAVLVSLAGLCLAAIACLSPVHNDTWWHLAYGREMAEIGGFAQVDRFSHTAFGRPFPNHQWLAQRIFFGLHSLGGLPLLTGFCAALLTSGWVLCWRLSRGPLVDRLLITAAAVAGSTLVWSIRPQVFTLALLPFTITLLVRNRQAWLPIVTLVWANLHGGVLLGLIAIGVWAAVAFVSGSPRGRRLLGTFALSGTTTLANPLGAGYWPEVFASLARSQRNRVHEWQAPGLPPEHMIFWAGAVVLIVMAVRRWHLLDMPGRALVATALVFFAAATRTLRNIAPFLMMAGPALTALGGRPRPSWSLAQASRAEWALLVASAFALSLVVGSAWTGPWARLEWEPVTPAAAAAIRTCPAPIYNTYVDGGPIIWFVPEQRVFVDSRQDSFPDEIVRAATAVEAGASPVAVFSKYGVRCAALPHQSLIARTLLEAGWHVVYRDSQWVVLTGPTTHSRRTGA